MKMLVLTVVVAVGGVADAFGQTPAFPTPAWSRTTAAAVDRGTPIERDAAYLSQR